jgi:hypothetical protein
MRSITIREKAREKRIACANIAQTIWTLEGKGSQPNPSNMVAERSILLIVHGEGSGSEEGLGRSDCPCERGFSVIQGSMTKTFVSAVKGCNYVT